MTDLTLTRSNPVSIRHGARYSIALLMLLAFMMTLTPQPAEAQNRPLLRVKQVQIVDGKILARIGLGSALVPEDVIREVLLGVVPGGSASCPILSLRINEIHLSLLGLNVDTSDICLDIRAERSGGLLGNLLCQVGQLLNRGISLADILRLLSPQQTQRLLNAIRDLLQAALDEILTNPNTRITNTGLTCPVLHLELGPIMLNLLGLIVELDDCANGPVVVDITADPTGGLLGQLLCGLTGNPLTILQNLIRQILGTLG